MLLRAFTKAAEAWNQRGWCVRVCVCVMVGEGGRGRVGGWSAPASWPRPVATIETPALEVGDR